MNPRQKPNPCLWDDSFRLEVEGKTVEEGVSIWRFASACLGIRTPEALIYTDAFFGGEPEGCNYGVHYNCPLPIDPEKIACADAVVISHEHSDHCHRETLLPMVRNLPNLKIYAPENAVSEMLEYGIDPERMHGISAGESFKIADINVETWPAHDPDSEGAVTYVMDCAGVRVFFGGDTRFGSTFEEIGAAMPVDVAMLAFGRVFYMSEKQMLDAASVLRPKLLIPYHWDFGRGCTGDPLKLGRIIERERPKFDVELLMMGDYLHYLPNGSYTRGFNYNV